MILDDVDAALKAQADKGLLRVIDDHLGASEQTASELPTTVDFYSNDYLGIAQDPAVHEALLQELQASSAPLIGAGGVRTTSGNTPHHTTLERRLAHFYDAESALLFNSGFDANYGVFAAVPQPNDAIIFDELSHASVRDGIKASRAKTKISFRHNDTHDLRQQIARLTAGAEEQYRSGKWNVFVAVESLYSMDGDFAPLRDIVSTIEEALPKGNGYLITDEAHSTGIFGLQGRGMAYEAGIHGSCFIQLHTFSKGLGTIGAVILCPAAVRTYIINFARSFRYSTAQPKLNLTAISVVYDFLEGEEHPKRVEALHSVTSYMRSKFLARGFDLVAADAPNCPVLCLRCHNPRHAAAWLERQGFNVTPVTFPVVPKGTDRLRICVHAFNTQQDVDGLISKLEIWNARPSL